MDVILELDADLKYVRKEEQKELTKNREDWWQHA